MSELNEYLNELKASARQVMDGEGTAAEEATLWPLTVELGWLLTAVPEELDGLGLGVHGVSMLHTELGRGLAQVPFLAATLAVDALVQSDIDTKAELISRFTTGDAVTAPLADVSTVTLTDTLNGKLSVVPSADTASDVLVCVDDCVVLVKLHQAGVELSARGTWDTTRRLFDVTFSNVVLANQVVLARGDAAVAMIARLQSLRDFALAADCVGAAAGLLDITIEHLNTREQFGRPLALFQALKHRCADMKTLIDAAEALLADSLSRITDEQLAEIDSQLLAKKAKLVACSMFADVSEEALQLHGGIGMASEHPCHLFLKRSMLNEHLGSGNGNYELDIADHFLAQLA
ncbi:acyl-CoA/acyl-ACP dehydrogenase [Aestuariicella hydrocarbonica]|uniref:Acyl-CoA/acyl-ACP dehydrogenase n=1 Tax=Pseudomaricurvus hydrocarbonicus TaxID=1470433 RepID=A0A9E5MJV5_9GAMM|nr:acyl-CoA dehydrogenase family protein [Aestuariicella hydrocarbonica]NHO65694.1 acyl-CoA/acyl-ACP dehydrogenase [Aestuariicella hydrocarbonica]